MEYYFTTRLRELFEAYKSRMTSQAEMPSSDDDDSGYRPTPQELEFYSKKSKIGASRSGDSHRFVTERSLAVADQWLKKHSKIKFSKNDRVQAIRNIADHMRGLVFRREVGAHALDNVNHPMWHGKHFMARLEKYTNPNYKPPPPETLKQVKKRLGPVMFASLFKSAPQEPKPYTPTVALKPLEGKDRVKMTGGLVLGKGKSERVKPFKPVTDEDMQKRLRHLLKQAVATKPG